MKHLYEVVNYLKEQIEDDTKQLTGDKSDRMEMYFQGRIDQADELIKILNK